MKIVSGFKDNLSRSLESKFIIINYNLLSYILNYHSSFKLENILVNDLCSCLFRHWMCTLEYSCRSNNKRFLVYIYIYIYVFYILFILVNNLRDPCSWRHDVDPRISGVLQLSGKRAGIVWLWPASTHTQ